LIAKQGTTPKPAISSPAIAGPTIRAAWTMTLLRLTAFTTRSAPTISITKLCRVGLSTALTRPIRKTARKTIQGTTIPVAVTASRPIAGIAISVWVMISSRRFDIRSAIRPPQAPNSSIGRNCSAVVRPTATPLPVRLRISQIAATVCIQVPEREISWPVK
jgi:hypothetical protein